jgi:hypothetical protein
MPDTFSNANSSHILASVNTLLDSDVKDLSMLLPQIKGEPWLDAASLAYKLNPELSTKRLQIDSTTDWKGHTYLRLGHIIVNPKDELNTEALEKVYVYGELEGKPDNSNVIRINQNPETAKLFMNRMIEEARNHRNYAMGNMRTDSGRVLPGFLLYGRRGSGKTFFLNHIYARFHVLLDQSNTIWVRVNLVENFREPKGDSGLWLTTWINSQITKIVMRYYDPNSEFYDKSRAKPINISLGDQVYEYIMNQHKLNKTVTRKELNLWAYVRGVLQQKSTEAPEDPPFIPAYIGKYVLDQTLKSGYSLIVVLDGLDRLEATPAEQHKFDALNGQAEVLCRMSGKRGYALLTVRRSFVSDDVAVKLFNRGPRNNYKLSHIPLADIVGRRIDYLKDELKVMATKNDGWPTAIDYGDHLESFITYLKEKLTAKEDNTYFDTLDRFFYTNRRAQLQTIQLSYLEYLGGIKERLYFMTEFLCRGGNVFPPKPYDYHYDKKAKTVVRRLGIQGKKFDHHLLPTLCMYPHLQFDPATFESNCVPSFYGPMLGIRVMQLIEGYDKYIMRMTQDHMAPAILTSGEVAGILHKLFGYQENIIIDMIEEFAEYEFIGITGDGVPTAELPSRYNIYMMPKLEHVVTKIMYDIAYLNMSALRIPLKRSALEAEIPYFVARTVATHGGKSKTNLVNYVSAKITNSVGLFRLLKSINAAQKEQFETNLAKLDSREREIIDASIANESRIGFFDFLVTMRKNLETSIKLILPSIAAVDESLLSRILTEVEKYQTRWGAE